MATRAPEFRWVYANGFNLQITENELLLTVGVTEDVRKPTESINEQVGLALTLRSAKLLARTLTDAVANFEKVQGIEVPLAPEKLAELARSFEAGTNRKK